MNADEYTYPFSDLLRSYNSIVESSHEPKGQRSSTSLCFVHYIIAPLQSLIHHMYMLIIISNHYQYQMSRSQSMIQWFCLCLECLDISATKYIHLHQLIFLPTWQQRKHGVNTTLTYCIVILLQQIQSNICINLESCLPAHMMNGSAL